MGFPVLANENDDHEDLIKSLSQRREATCSTRTCPRRNDRVNERRNDARAERGTRTEHEKPAGPPRETSVPVACCRSGVCGVPFGSAWFRSVPRKPRYWRASGPLLRASLFVAPVSLSLSLLYPRFSPRFDHVFLHPIFPYFPLFFHIFSIFFYIFLYIFPRNYRLLRRSEFFPFCNSTVFYRL